MTRHGDLDRKVKKHLDAVHAIEGGWDHLLDMVHVFQIQRYLRESRILQGLTQAEVAEKMGVGQNRVAELENERYLDPKVSTLARWGNALGVEFDFKAVPKIQEEVVPDGEDAAPASD